MQNNIHLDRQYDSSLTAQFRYDSSDNDIHDIVMWTLLNLRKKIEEKDITGNLVSMIKTLKQLKKL